MSSTKKEPLRTDRENSNTALTPNTLLLREKMKGIKDLIGNTRAVLNDKINKIESALDVINNDITSIENMEAILSKSEDLTTQLKKIVESELISSVDDDKNDQVVNKIDEQKEASNSKVDEDQETKLKQVDSLYATARKFVGDRSFDLAKIKLEEAQGIYATKNVEDLLEDLSNSYDNAQGCISKAHEKMNEGKTKEAEQLIQTAVVLFPSNYTRNLLKDFNEKSVPRNETPQLLNYYETSTRDNESSRYEAQKCFFIAKTAFDKGQYDKAKRLISKSLRICGTDEARALETDILKQQEKENASNSDTKKRERNLPRIEKIAQYMSCIEFARSAVADGDITRAKRLLNKAIRINPRDNDDARQMLQQVLGFKDSKPEKDNVSVTKSISYSKQERDAHSLIKLCVANMEKGEITIANNNLIQAYYKLPTQPIYELFCYLRIRMSIRLNEHLLVDMKVVSNRLLDRVDSFVKYNQFENAELFLVVAWYMHYSQRTLSIHKKFLEARRAKLTKAKCLNDENQKLVASDGFVLSALKLREEGKLGEAEDLLMKAAELNPCVRIEKLLNEIDKGPSE